MNVVVFAGVGSLLQTKQGGNVVTDRQREPGALGRSVGTWQLMTGRGKQPGRLALGVPGQGTPGVVDSDGALGSRFRTGEKGLAGEQGWTCLVLFSLLLNFVCYFDLARSPLPWLADSPIGSSPRAMNLES